MTTLFADSFMSHYALISWVNYTFAAYKRHEV